MAILKRGCGWVAGLLLGFGWMAEAGVDGPHTIVSGPGTGVNLDASGGVVSQPNANGVINPPGPGVPFFHYNGTLFGLPDPGSPGGWEQVAPGFLTTPPNATLPPAGYSGGLPAFQILGNLAGPGLAGPGPAPEPGGPVMDPGAGKTTREVLGLNNAVGNEVNYNKIEYELRDPVLRRQIELLAMLLEERDRAVGELEEEDRLRAWQTEDFYRRLRTENLRAGEQEMGAQEAEAGHQDVEDAIGDITPFIVGGYREVEPAKGPKLPPKPAPEPSPVGGGRVIHVVDGKEMTTEEMVQDMLRRVRENAEAFERAKATADRVLQESGGDKRRAADRLKKMTDDMKKSGYLDRNVERELRRIEARFRAEAELEKAGSPPTGGGRRVVP